eukprot:184599-Hanusia_phi.AAC.1
MRGGGGGGGGEKYVVLVERQSADARVWKTLSEFSVLHPEEFDERGQEEEEEEEEDSRRRRRRNKEGTRSKNTVEELKQNLMRRNEQIT